MERTLNADFSTVRIHEGGEAESVGARAYARGEHLHFRPGAFRPGTGEGMRILAHELTHVVQQRRGVVRPTAKVGGLPLNDEARLEREADAAGARAVWTPAPLPASAFVPAPRDPGTPGDAAVQGWFEKVRNWWRGTSAPNAPRKRNPVTLPPRYTGGKPDKPETLKLNDAHGKPLSFHHKYPSNKIINDTNLAVAGNVQAATNVGEWAQRGTTDPISSIKQIAWTRHNVFPGPAPELREDDPGGGEADPHFTASGTVTPRSKLAVELDAKGGLGGIDPAVLQSRLAALASLQASAYDPNEWEPGSQPGKVRQKGKPRDWSTRSPQERLAYANTSSTWRRLQRLTPWTSP
jgi:hypothetical protein